MSTNTMPSFTPATFTPAPIPAAPSLGVTNPTTAPRESFLRSLLDPTSTTYLGAKYKPDLQAAGRSLQQGLEGFGDYTFAEDAQGLLTPKKADTGQPGSLYRGAYFDARSQAAARGMLYSRTAQQAVGDAWHRLNDQERNVLSQYAGQSNEILGRMAGEFSSTVNELTGLYGSDVQWALDHPVIASDAATGSQPASNGSPYTQDVVDASAAPYTAWAARAGAAAPASGPNPLLGVRGAWGTPSAPAGQPAPTSLGRPAAPAQSYSDWLRAHGLHSSKANAAKWRAVSGG